MQLQSEKEEIKVLTALHQPPSEYAAPFVGGAHRCALPPGWFVSPITQKSQPCSGVIVEDVDKGRCLASAMDFSVGDVVAIDFSIFSWPTNPLTFTNCRAVQPGSSLWPWCPPPQRGSSTISSDAIHLAELHAQEQDALFTDCELVAKRALFVYGPWLAQHSSVMCVCSLIVQCGDTKLLLPPSRDSGSLEEQLPFQSVDDRLCRRLQLRSDVECSKICEILADWSCHFDDYSQGERNQRLEIADAVLDCIPDSYFAVDDDHDGRRKMGFFARCGLDSPLAIAQFLSICETNSLEVSIPSLPRRMGMFPFVRYCEHECRPSCAFSFLDNLESHSDEFVSIREVDLLTSKEDKFEAKPPPSSSGQQKLGDVSSGNAHKRYASRRLFAPSAVIVTAIRPIAKGERITISYVASTYMMQRERQEILRNVFSFRCHCRWCMTEPDLTRGFRCPECPRNSGVICPTGDGAKWDEWECLQCGFHPDFALVTAFLDQERKLAVVKADKTIGMAKLLGDDLLHYTHAVVFRKADAWSEESWKQQDARMCINYIEMLIKCTDRVLQEFDPSKAQFHEFLAQMNHAVGNAHTAKYEYELSYQIRCAAGQRLTYWAARTRFMAKDKSLADLMDSK